MARFLFRRFETYVPLSRRIRVLWDIERTTLAVDCPHTNAQILPFMMEILSLPKSVNGCIVEAGCYKGGSTAKFSMAANLAGRSLVVFDSFRGIPPNDEQHGHTIFGTNAEFPEGDWCGSLNEVKQTIRKFGSIECCEFVDGWIEDTMPSFRRTVAATYLDVDLADSTRTCLKYLYPQLVPGGAIYSQDGHLPLVLEVFDDPTLWHEVLHAEKPEIDGFGKSQLISLRKERGPVR